MELEDRLKAANASPDELKAAHEVVTTAMVAYSRAGYDPMEASVPHDTKYAHRMHGGLLSHSVAQDWHEAVNEWAYDRVCGYSRHQLVCDLCLCTKVQYWFRIRNVITGRSMTIGSECIQNWHSPGIVTAIEYDRKKLVKEQQKERRIADLEQAALADPWLASRLPSLRKKIEKYGRVFDEAADRVKAALKGTA